LRDALKRALCDSSDWHPRLAEEVARVAGIKATQRVKSRVYVTSASTLHSLFNVLVHGSEESVISEKGRITDLNYLTHIVFRCYERVGEHDADEEVKRWSSKSSLKSSMSHPDMSDLLEKSQQGQPAMPRRSTSGAYPQDKGKFNSKLKSSSSQPDIAALNRLQFLSGEGSTSTSSPRLIKTAEAERAKANYRVEISVSPGVQVLDGGVVKEWPAGSEFCKEGCSVAPLEVIAEIPLGQLEDFLTELMGQYDSSDDLSEAGEDD